MRDDLSEVASRLAAALVAREEKPDPAGAAQLYLQCLAALKEALVAPESGRSKTETASAKGLKAEIIKDDQGVFKGLHIEFGPEGQPSGKGQA